MNPAQSSRLSKEKNPQDWCSDSRCLWHVSRSGPCPRHPHKVGAGQAIAASNGEPTASVAQGLARPDLTPLQQEIAKVAAEYSLTEPLAEVEKVVLQRNPNLASVTDFSRAAIGYSNTVILGIEIVGAFNVVRAEAAV